MDMEESGKANIITSETSKPSQKKDEVEINNSKYYYHYRLNFKNGVRLSRPRITNDVGYIISTALGRDQLYGALFLTNLKFNDPRTVQQYLALTYTPRFRYKVKTNCATHICKDNGQPITFRTCPAFGKHGGAGEWVILPPKTTKTQEDKQNKKTKRTIRLTSNYFFQDGGATDRWYMGGLDEKLLMKVLIASLKAYSGKKIDQKNLKKAFKSGGTSINKKEEGITPFFKEGAEGEKGEKGEKGEEGAIIASESGIVGYIKKGYYNITDNKENKYIALFYISVSVGFQQTASERLYLKFWGNMWIDLFRKDSQNTNNNKIKCDEFSYSQKDTKGTIEIPKSLYMFKDPNICGIRLITKNIVTSDYLFEDIENNDLLSELINEKIINLKKILLSRFYSDPFDSIKVSRSIDLVLWQSLLNNLRFCSKDERSPSLIYLPNLNFGSEF